MGFDDVLAGETIPIRLFLGGFELTPTFREVNKKFSVRYYLNLVLIDEENRRYFKQQVSSLSGVRFAFTHRWHLTGDHCFPYPRGASTFHFPDTHCANDCFLRTDNDGLCCTYYTYCLFRNSSVPISDSLVWSCFHILGLTHVLHVHVTPEAHQLSCIHPGLVSPPAQLASICPISLKCMHV